MLADLGRAKPGRACRLPRRHKPSGPHELVRRPRYRSGGGGAPSGLIIVDAHLRPKPSAPCELQSWFGPPDLPLRVIRDRVGQRQVLASSAMPPKAEVFTASGCVRDRLHAGAAIGVSYDEQETNTLAGYCYRSLWPRLSPRALRPSARRHWRYTSIAAGCRQARSRKRDPAPGRRLPADVRRVWPICDFCGVSGGNRRAVRRTLIFSGRRPS